MQLHGYGTVPVLVRVLFTNVDSTVLMYVYAMSTVRVQYCTVQVLVLYRYSYSYSEACEGKSHECVPIRARCFLVSTVFHGPVRIV